MRSVILFFICVAFSFTSFGQLKDPVKWSTTSKKIGNSYVVTLTATLPKPWHIYSQFTGKGGPLPTTFKFTKNPLTSLEGTVQERGKLVQSYDKNFDTNVKYYGGKVDFVQTVKIKANVKTNLSFTVEYMTCNDEQCLPPTKKTFSVSL